LKATAFVTHHIPNLSPRQFNSSSFWPKKRSSTRITLLLSLAVARSFENFGRLVRFQTGLNSVCLSPMQQAELTWPGCRRDLGLQTLGKASLHTSMKSGARDSCGILAVKRIFVRP
jgi:hypothetical protein